MPQATGNALVTQRLPGPEQTVTPAAEATGLTRLRTTADTGARGSIGLFAPYTPIDGTDLASICGRVNAACVHGTGRF